MILEKNIDCSKCKGAGKTKVLCSKCYGDKTIKYPKSTRPPVDQAKYYNGRRVSVITKPSGGTVQTIETKTEEYGEAKRTPALVDWYFSKSVNKPLLINCQGIEIKVFPLDQNGEAISKIVVDFTTGSPIVEKGTLEK